jgi:hypothetical protein
VSTNRFPVLPSPDSTVSPSGGQGLNVAMSSGPDVIQWEHSVELEVREKECSCGSEDRVRTTQAPLCGTIGATPSLQGGVGIHGLEV